MLKMISFDKVTENLGIRIVTKKVLKGIVPIAISLHAPETKTRFLYYSMTIFTRILNSRYLFTKSPI